MKNIALIVITMFMLLGCASTPKRPPMNISSFSLFSTFSFGENINKAYYDPLNEIAYAMVSGKQEIYVLKSGKNLNVIGGMGMAANNFQTLADISIASDGGLYALDSSQKNLRKFSSDGKLLSTMDLKSTSQAAAFAIGGEQIAYIWDSAASEIISFNLLDGTEQFRFGRFQVQRISHLSANRDFVVAYDQATNTSTVFSSMGQLIGIEEGQILYDGYNNAISMTSNGLISKMSPAFLPLSEGYGIVTISRNVLSLVMGTEVRVLRLDYEQVP